ncbi:S8 family serine peptidase [Brevibacillus sp. HB2.2]|uniref:S8 family serine peptidase n=1 Tax=Brevibacillus sp. HB2.2 TaxID=2738846 RepID=UPI00156BC238|nr:S8 family serine peptidase [Brevibacillus sp. HB2.2]NRS51170.1 S8 family serine peptidase [Brevibacillus sp. HB2.2]
MRKKELRNRECSKKIPQRYIVNFIDGVSEKEQDKIVKQFGGKVLKKFRTPAFDRFAVVHIDDEQVEQLLSHKLVESIDQEVQGRVPSSTEKEGWGIQVAMARNFWEAGYTGAGVKIAVIDTGINPHEDLPNLLGAWNVITDSPDRTDISPGDGHGTCSAGVIAARGNNNRGIKGVAYEAELYSICCYFVRDNEARTNTSNVVEALEYAATLDIDVVLCNVQLSTGGSALQAACDALEAKGVPILAAAGNFGDLDPNKDTVRYPGHFDKVIAVGSVELGQSIEQLDRVNTSGSGPYLDIASYTGQPATTKTGGYTDAYYGTSCATPFATGVMALIKQAYPSLNAQQLRDKLYQGVTPYGTQNEYGRGLIGLPISLLPSPPTYPVLLSSTMEDFSDSSFNFNLTGDFILGTDQGRTVLRTPPIDHFKSASSKMTFQVPTNAINPEISITTRVDSGSYDTLVVLINGIPLVAHYGIDTNYITKTKSLQPGGKYRVDLYWEKSMEGAKGLDAAFIDSIAVTFTTNGSGGGTPGDTFTNPIVVSGTNASGTLQDTKDLYFKYTAPNTGSYTFTTTASFDSYMQLLDSSQNILAQDDDGAGSSQPKIIYSLSAGQVVYLKVYGYNHGAGKYGPITLNITPASSGSAPGTPNLTVSSPTTSSLTLNYFASGATTYDIYRNGVRIVAGTTQTSYQDTGLSANTTYSYFVIGINSYGTTTSTSVYGTTLSSSGGGVTPTTILEDFEDANMNFNFSGDWTRVTRGYQSTYAFISTVPAVGASSSTQFTVSVPAGATTAQLKFNARCDSSKSTTPLCDLQVFVNGSLKLTLPANATTWYVDQVVALGTGDQTIKFQWNRNNNNTSFLRQAIIDSVEVKWS